MHPHSTPDQRFWSKVSREFDCWLWQGTKTGNGYGRFWDGQRMVLAHRWAYEQLRGPIPAGLQADHRCRHRNCVNPQHIDLVTARGNSLTAYLPNAMKLVCVRGHPLTGSNLQLNSKGNRQCRACQRIHQHRYDLKRRKARALLGEREESQGCPRCGHDAHDGRCMAVSYMTGKPIPGDPVCACGEEQP